MKKNLLLICILISGCLMLSGCPSWDLGIKTYQSNLMGLNRHITLYGADGKIIREWDGKIMVEFNGSTARFIIDDKVLIISGTYVVEEK